MFCAHVNVTDSAEQSIIFPQAVSLFHTPSRLCENNKSTVESACTLKRNYASAFLSPHKNIKLHRARERDEQALTAHLDL